MIGVMLAAHGRLGEELLKSAERLVGRQEAVAVVGLDSNETPDALEKKVRAALDQLAVSAGVLVLADMMGGTPCNVSLRQYRGLSTPFDLVTGVNLPMLVSALTHRHHMPLGQLAQKLVDDSARNILRPLQRLSRP